MRISPSQYLFGKMTIALAFLLLGVGTACASDISAEQRQCRSDNDCALIGIGCQCISCTPQLEAVNKEIVPQLKYLEACSRAETRRCAESGACPQITKPRVICQQGQCGVVYVPAQH